MGGGDGEILDAAFDAAHVVGITHTQAFRELFLRPSTSAPELCDATPEGHEDGGASLHAGTCRPLLGSETTYRWVCGSLRDPSR